jgi:hypothetical protein
MQFSRTANPNTFQSGARIRCARRLLWLAVALFFAAVGAPTLHAQLTTIQNTGRVPPTGVIPIPGSVQTTSVFQQRRVQQLNVERQKEIVSDTDKLVRLIADLNTEVENSHSTSLTPDQLRMLAKIEKLAKSVKDKMVNPVQGTIFEDNFPPPMAPVGIP